jgi:hypothetical protein
MRLVHQSDHYDLTCVAHLTRRDEVGEQPRILLLDQEDPYVIDGNHGAVAVYEWRRLYDNGTFRPWLHVLQMSPVEELVVHSTPTGKINGKTP